MRFLAICAIVGFFGLINAKELTEKPLVEKVENRLETNITIDHKIAEIKAKPVEIIPANVGEMSFKILADEDGFYALYLGDDKTNMSINSPADFFSASFAVMEAFNKAYEILTQHNASVRESKILKIFKTYPQYVLDFKATSKTQTTLYMLLTPFCEPCNEKIRNLARLTEDAHIKIIFVAANNEVYHKVMSLYAAMQGYKHKSQEDKIAKLQTLIDDIMLLPLVKDDDKNAMDMYKELTKARISYVPYIVETSK